MCASPMTAGAILGWRWGPLDSVGLYVPGGTAAYPSSLLMNAVPARVAGVGRIVMVTPATGGAINPLTLAAATIAGVSRDLSRGRRAGGCRARLWHGDDPRRSTRSWGLGNAYVAAAKREVFGQVGIDSIAGPSEILVIADSRQRSRLDRGRSSVAGRARCLVAIRADHRRCGLRRSGGGSGRRGTRDAAARDIAGAFLARPRRDHPRGEDRGRGRHRRPLRARAPRDRDRRSGGDLRQACVTPGPAFLGRYTPEAIGDYVAGPNHVLPTSRTARFSSGLSVLDFMKRTTILSCDADALSRLGPAALDLAKAEGLDAHGRSIAIRLNRT